MDDDLVEALSSIDRRLDGPDQVMKELAGELGRTDPWIEAGPRAA